MRESLPKVNLFCKYWRGEIGQVGIKDGKGKGRWELDLLEKDKGQHKIVSSLANGGV